MGRSDLRKAIDEHDIVVLPSFVESFGTIALESMVRSRITVVSDACGIVEWPEMTEGLFVYSNEDTFAKALYGILDMDAEVIRKKVAAGRKAALQLNDWNFSIWCDILLGKS